jgi:hypothetical protein
MAKKKINTPKARTKAAKEAAKSKKTSEPKSNVKVVPADKTLRARKNRESFYATEKAKSGTTAYQKAEDMNYEMRKRRNSAVSRIKTVKVRSGAGGLGGMYNPKNK